MTWSPSVRSSTAIRGAEATDRRQVVGSTERGRVVSRSRVAGLIVALGAVVVLWAAPALAQDYPGTSVAPSSNALTAPAPGADGITACGALGPSRAAQPRMSLTISAACTLIKAGHPVAGATVAPHSGADHLDALVKAAAAVLAAGALVLGAGRRRAPGPAVG
jgi:hypothetical protein